MRNKIQMPLQGELQTLVILGKSMAIDWLYSLTIGAPRDGDAGPC